ncbi:hypothetical protein VR010_06090 [Actinomycetaceae bacterium L2_0104]
MSYRRAFATVLALFAVVLAAGCARQVDNYSDDYEQDIVDLLDSSAIVTSHDARVDGWAHAENVPGPPARVVLEPDADAQAWADLLLDLTDLRVEHGENVPVLEFETPDTWANLTFAGSAAEEATGQLVETAAGGDWSSITVWAQTDEPRVLLSTGVSSAEEGAALTTRELPPYIADNLDSQRVALPDGHAVQLIEGREGPIHPELFSLAFALDDVAELLPDPGDSLTYDLSTEWVEGEPRVRIDTEVRADVLREAEPDERPALAAELGYTAVCGRVSDLAAEHVTEAVASTHCTATHVEIGG